MVNYWSNPFSDEKNITNHVFMLIALLYVFSFIIIGIFALAIKGGSGWFIWSNGLMVAGAATICGFLIGFLFGIPRSIRYGAGKNTNNNIKPDNDTYFADNTNLEEISDWITKIIVGLSLTQYEKIMKLLDTASINVAKIFSTASVSYESLVAFAYALLILNFGLGFFGAYYWARTRFGTILMKSRTELLSFINTYNRNLSNVSELGTASKNMESHGLSLESLKSKVNSLLEARPIQDATDTQNGRWGKKSENNMRKLTATVKSSIIPMLFDVTIQVESTSAEAPLETPVVVLLDNTFIENVIYLQPVGNIAKVKVLAYEAFTVAALCDNAETELELDLQKGGKNYPSGFYYKE